MLPSLDFTKKFFLLLSLELLHWSQQGRVREAYVQSVEWQLLPPFPGGTQSTWQAFWRSTSQDTPGRVIDLYPEPVYLEYNCFDMEEICRNARDFYASARGQGHNPSTQFAYDLNSTRADDRRDESCPSGKYGNRNILVPSRISYFLCATMVCGLART